MLAVSSDHLLSHLTGLSQLVLYAPKVVEVKKEHGKAKEDDWAEDEDLDDECKAKLLSIKILVNRLVALALSKAEHVGVEVQSVFKTLWTLIDNDGELLPDKSTRPSYLSRLRLAAARAILKLARHKVYEDMIKTEDFEKLALTIQDPCFHVRNSFSERLIRYLGSRRIHTRYYTMLMLVAHEPEADLKIQVKKFLTREAKSKKIRMYSGTLDSLAISPAPQPTVNHVLTVRTWQYFVFPQCRRGQCSPIRDDHCTLDPPASSPSRLFYNH
ncbi:hypothetical protein BC936DRAFT_141239 [Jimgerdemannia flammicorona]|uniref:Uncharacterized protein n=1 Tax=Jimgerdemannia flammicorona TaxID=994334 RepID=A0A433A2P1_9FUNG|nr:hypothetical protein BC936DRAFT_141239 [Jimgerdemannia flammicorona]